MNILTIPRELQVHIFGLLPVPDRLRVSETCHLLKDAARDPALWKKLTLCYHVIKNNMEVCRDQVARCSTPPCRLRELFVIFPHHPQGRIRSDKIMSVVMKAKGTLKTLSVDNLRLSNSSFNQISKMTQLTRLDINAVNMKSDGIAELANLSELQSLKMTNLIRVYGSCTLKNLVDFFSSLKKLEIVDLDGYGQLNDEVIESLVVNNLNLNYLNIRHTSMNDHPEVTGKSLNIIAVNCPQLIHIDIGDLYELSNDDILTFVSKCSKLKYANFEGTRIEDSALARMAQDCPDLEDLRISECLRITVAGIDAFLDKASKAKLKRLDIRDCGALWNGDRLSFLDRLEKEYPHIDITS